jgi:2-(1,2-epoxy-1,2-dihydrophenyl)acetyl-CoA isomerase
LSEIIGDVSVEVGDDHVATVEIHRPPSNFFDALLIRRLSDVFSSFDNETDVRAIVLCSEGRHFCAGADFHEQSAAEPLKEAGASDLYDQAVRLFDTKTPSVAAIQGAAIGGGLGLALAADFRVTCPEGRFAANFSRLGLHQGFGLSVTLPAVVGQQAAMDLLYTGRRIDGTEAHRIGLADRLVDLSDVRAEAHRLASEIAAAGPLAVASIRQTLRGQLAGLVRAIVSREDAEQVRLRSTADFAEGIAASGARRDPVFEGR